MTLMCSSFSHSFVALARRFGSLVKPVLVQDLWYIGPVHRPRNGVKSPCTLSRETVPKRNVSTSMLDGWDGALGVLVSTSVPPNMTSRVDARELNVGLTSNHIMLIINHSGVHLQASDGPLRVASCVWRPCELHDLSPMAMTRSPS